MKNLSSILFLFVGATSATTAVGCGDDGMNPPAVECGSGTVLMDGECIGTGSGSGVTCGAGTMESNGMCVATPPTRTFVQVEHLARPGINEALLLSNGFQAGYNATAPTFTGVPAPVLGQVVEEAKTVLKALYLGGCLLNGTIPGVTAVNGVHPAGLQCHAIGPAIWTENSLAGVTLTQASKDASQAYADAVFGLFIPDVMRVDTTNTSKYETLCGGANVGLCGGRFLNDDVIDTTYDFLLNGAGTPKSIAMAPNLNQVNALVSDGVVFDNKIDANNSASRVVGDPNNHAQGHPAITQGFPYSAKPY